MPVINWSKKLENDEKKKKEKKYKVDDAVKKHNKKSLLKKGIKLITDAEKFGRKKVVPTVGVALSLGKKYKAKSYVEHVTRSTATMYIRKPYSKNGLRNEFTSRGYTGESGTPELDARWRTRTEAPGSLKTPKLTAKGSLITKSRKFPTMSGISASLDSDISMPVGIRKAKRRRV